MVEIIHGSKDCYHCHSGAKHTKHEMLTYGDVQKRYKRAVDTAMENYRIATENVREAGRGATRLKKELQQVDLELSNAAEKREDARRKMDYLLLSEKVPPETLVEEDNRP